MIEVRELRKRYGAVRAVDGLTFTVPAGCVTAFLGPNGAGKSTTMRILLGLAAPDAGRALIDGHRYAGLRAPLRHVGALLEADAVHPGRSAVNHLGWLARTHRIGTDRVAAVLEMVGLAGVARRRVGGFSLGMRQRLGIAAALLGDPPVLLFDEPVNGLDPDGVRWIRQLLRGLAGQGRTVLLASHLMSEVELTADRLVVVAAGRLIAEATVRELADRYRRGVLVRTPREAELTTALTGVGAEVSPEPGGGLSVAGLAPEAIGELAACRGIPVYEVTPRAASLEEAYLQLTAEVGR